MLILRFTILSILAVFLFSQSSFAQTSKYDTYRCYGIIVDNETNEPLPFAHIVLQGSTYGTIANSEGRFSLPIDHGVEVVLEISIVGYQKRIYNIGILTEDKYIESKHASHEKLLKEVVVKPKNYEQKLLKAAINKIPDNYPDQEEVLRFFARNIGRAKDAPYYVIEFTGLAEKKPYTSASSSGNVQVLESQKVEFQALDSLGIRFFSGGHIAHWTDYVAMRAAVLNLDKLSDYELELTDTIPSESNPIYVIDFWPKSKSEVHGKGQVFIESQSYAIVKFKIRHEDGDFGALEGLKTALNGYNRLYKDLEVSYVRSADHWRLSNAHYETAFEKNGQLKVELKDELVVLGVDTVKQIEYLDRLDYRDILLEQVDEYDSNYWKDQNVLLASEDVKRALSEADVRDKQEPTKPEKLLNLLSRIEFYFGLGVTDYRLSATRVVYSVQEQRILHDWLRIFHANYYYSYALSDHWSVGFSGLSAYGERHRYEAYMPGIAYQINLNKGGRPIKVKPMLSAGYMNMELRMGSIEKENYVGEALRKFDANHAKMFLTQSSLTVGTQLELSIEFTSRLSFGIQGGINQLFFPQHRLKLKEDQFFLKQKSIKLKNGEDGLIIEPSSGFVLKSNWNLSAGLVWGF